MDSDSVSFSRRGMLYAAVGQFLVCAALISLVSQYPRPNDYSFISAALRHWDFRAVPADQPKEFWGLPYLSAVFAGLTSLSDTTAILIIDFCAYLATIVLCERLWGRLIAVWFMVVNWFWLDSSVAGGCEPVFMALLLGSFLAVRKERWILAATLASCASIVRPIGIFALVAIGGVLLMRRDIRKLLLAVSIGAVTGLLYLTPLTLAYGSPMASIRSYQSNDWAGASPVTIPLLPIIKGALYTRDTMRLPLKILIGFWVLLTLAGMIRWTFGVSFRRHLEAHPVEAIFAVLYTVFLFSYNTNFWVWQHFPRFALPVLPFVLMAFRGRLPASRPLLAGVAIASIICVVLPKAGIETIVPLIHKLAVVERTLPCPPAARGGYGSAACSSAVMTQEETRQRSADEVLLGAAL